MTTELADDLGLEIALTGVQLIEASAGTGKTFTLATLYTRLLIEAGLPVAAILAVTYTEAATKELRSRLRERLLIAQRVVEAALDHHDLDCPDEPGDDHATQLTRMLVRAALQREQPMVLRGRLRLAAAQMDLAPIHTIHGFCRRALADHALESGQPLRERELLQNENALRREIALEFWREHSRQADSAAVLASIWTSPDVMARNLRELTETEVLLPPPLIGVDDASVERLRQAQLQLHDAFVAHGATSRELLRQACAQRAVHATYSKDSAVDPVWSAVQDWLPVAGARDLKLAKLDNYGSSRLRDLTLKNQQTPESPVFDAIEQWQQARDAREAVLGRARIAMLHLLRRFARERMEFLKQERGLLGFDDMIRGVAEALAGPNRAFADRLQAQYAVALVDEFQDTDPRQWAIFRRLFADAPAIEDQRPRALFLIGDPKQAIYRFRGGDVFTYLNAAARADTRHRLERNFRSRPSALRAVQAVFELSGADAFAQPGIHFEPVQPGGACTDAALRIDDEVAPALVILALEDAGERQNIDETRARATDACVAAIHGLLAKGLEGRARLVDADRVERSVEPQDIAVLVEANKDAERMQRALALAGIPSVAAGRSSLYDSAEARHLCWLLQALLAPADEPRFRAALAAPLFGLDAADLIAFDVDALEHRRWQDRFDRWQQRAQRFGPLAVISEICAEQGCRLLDLQDGERRLSNYMQLAEELQSAESHVLGLAGLLAELERRIEDADAANDAELLRLESDASRVKIMTVHMSKGLEFELVFLPYLATNGGPRGRSTPELAQFHDGNQRVALLYPDKSDPGCNKQAAEERAEKLRLLYVALTRARLATWAVWGAASGAEKTPMAWLLHREQGQALLGKVDAATAAQRIALLQVAAPGAIVHLTTQDAARLPRLEFGGNPKPPRVALASRVLSRDWWVHSFSQLAREQGGVDAVLAFESHAADDEQEPPATVAYSRFSGTRFGNCLHAALENIDMARWLDWTDAQPPEADRHALVRALADHGYDSAEDRDQGLPLLTLLIRDTVNVRLPEGARLACLPAWARCKEMEFHLALAPAAVSDVLAVLHQFGIVSGRSAFGLRERLEGLLTGRIDLIYEFAGRYYVLDYKSNQLADYGSDAVADAVAHSEYDLQYVLYALALHRWLRFKLGGEYDPDTHLGGVRYVFCRGLDCNRDDSPGIHAPQLPTALLEALDDLWLAVPA